MGLRRMGVVAEEVEEMTALVVAEENVAVTDSGADDAVVAVGVE